MLCACDGRCGADRDTGLAVWDTHHDTACGPDSPFPSDWPTSTGDADARFETGRFLAGVGDVDADGFDDILLGGAHRSYLLTGPLCGYEDDRDANAILQLELGTKLWSGSGAGDLDGDGRADMLLADYTGTPDNGRSGLVFVVLGPAWGEVRLQDEADLTLVGREHAGLGFRLGAAGDVDGDGVADLLVSAPNESAHRRNGAVFILSGDLRGASGIDNAASGVLAGSDQHGFLGYELAALGDTDGDGLGDFVTSSTDQRMWLVRGPVVGSRSVGEADVEIVLEESAIGGAVSGAGDQDGDGLADLVIGTTYIHSHGIPGTVHLYSGLVDGTVSGDQARSVLVGEQGSFGGEIALAGDVNADGLEELLIGQGSSTDEDDHGVYYLLHGAIPTGTLTPAEAGIVIRNLAPEQGSGGLVAGGGDTNGDGFDDVLLGSTYEGTLHTEFVAHLLLGRAGVF